MLLNYGDFMKVIFAFAKNIDMRTVVILSVSWRNPRRYRKAVVLKCASPASFSIRHAKLSDYVSGILNGQCRLRLYWLVISLSFFPCSPHPPSSNRDLRDGWLERSDNQQEEAFIAIATPTVQ